MEQVNCTPLPPFGKRFFKRIRKLIGYCHFSHLWQAVVANSSLTGEFFEDYAEIAGIEMLLFDSETSIAGFRNRIRFNDVYYAHSK